MIYKDFIAEAAQKLMAETIKGPQTDAELKRCARECIAAAKALADALEEDYMYGGVKRYGEKETFFDNYVNCSKTV